MTGDLLHPSPAPQLLKMFELLDYIADVQTKTEGEEMGFHNEAMAKESAAKGAKLAQAHDGLAKTAEAASKRYESWLSEIGAETQTKISKTPKK